MCGAEGFGGVCFCGFLDVFFFFFKDFWRVFGGSILKSPVERLEQGNQFFSFLSILVGEPSPKKSW